MNFLFTFLILFSSFSFSQNIDSSTLNFSAIDSDFLLGHLTYQNDKRFRIVDSFHTNRSIFLLKEVADAFEQMVDAAYKDGVCIDLNSGARNFPYQRYLWNKKWDYYDTLVPVEQRLEHILHYTALPGGSRHHWGTEVDLVSFSLAYWNSEEGETIYAWLQQHAEEFGFCQVYNSNPKRTGYKEEKWHWSYMPISQQLLELYLEVVQIEHLNGFKGHEFFQFDQFIEEYVFGIDCNTSKP